MRQLSLIFLDFETSGLDEKKHEVIEIGFVLCTPAGEILRTHEARIMPAGECDPGAAAVNGFTEEGWASSPLLRTPWDAFAPLAEASRHGSDKGAMLVAHNPSLERAFLDTTQRMLDDLYRGVPRFGKLWQGDYHTIDTATLAWPLVHAGICEKVSLESVCKALGVVNQRPHSALSDAMACREIYLKMMAGYGEALGLQIAANTTAEGWR